MKNVLLLGLGGGSVVKTLRDEIGYCGNITAVELDQAIIGIALHEFGLNRDKKLKIIHGDALQVVSSIHARFDLIIIDLFIHTDVPPVFYEPPFWIDVHLLLSARGVFLFNASVGRKHMRALNNMKATMADHFHYKQLNDVEGHNTLLIGRPINQAE